MREVVSSREDWRRRRWVWRVDVDDDDDVGGGGDSCEGLGGCIDAVAMISFVSVCLSVCLACLADVCLFLCLFSC